MKTKAVSLAGLLSLAALVPATHGQVVFNVTATPLSFNPNNPNHQVSLALTIPGSDAYNLLGVSFVLQIGGASPTVQTVPTIDLVTANSGNFPGSVVSPASDDTYWFKTISIDWTAKALSAPITTPIEFAVITVNASSFSSGSWPFSVTSLNFDDRVGTSGLETFSAPDVNGTFSAVPEPEETMAVMAGVSLGLGWWIRRRRSKTPQPRG